MFPFRKLFRLLVTLSILTLALTLALLAVASLFSTSPYEEKLLLFSRKALAPDEEYYADSADTFRARLLKEFQYKDQLSQLSEAEVEELSSKYHRDIKIQYTRELLPPPHPLYDINCLKYLDYDYDVTVSVVIPFYNELAMLLLRTLTTLQHRSLPRYLKEIVLIDDASTLNITREVEDYAREQGINLVLLRNEEKLGIANSRFKGIRAASSDVIVILDSHMEVNELWLEPLLSTVTNYPKSIAIPCIHMIVEGDYQQQEMKGCQPYLVNTVKGYSLIKFDDIDRVRGKGTREKWEPYPSSAMLGGALAAYKSTLMELYPQGLLSRSWSIENNRLSLRAWLCGEGLWMNTCSQVLYLLSFRYYTTIL